MALRDFSLMILVCLLWAAHTVVSKIVVTDMEIPPLFYAAIRYGIVAMLALPWLLPMPRPTWRILLVGFLMGGSVLAETVFARPGLGRLLVDSIARRDIPVVQTTIMLLSMTFVLVNLVVDLLYVKLDPRIQYD